MITAGGTARSMASGREAKISQLESALAYEFKQPALLQQAITHRSFGTPHNERLEFVGDAVLNCVIGTELYLRFPNWAEGELSRLRATIVNQASLVDTAQELELGGILRLGEGELKSGGHARPSILADALEAIVGAIYLDSGYDAARASVLRLFDRKLTAPESGTPIKDPKTALQELLQGRKLPLPKYSVLETMGEAHQQTFRIECVIDSLDLRGEGQGTSRRTAEQEAASAVLPLVQQRLGRKKRA